MSLDKHLNRLPEDAGQRIPVPADLHSSLKSAMRKAAATRTRSSGWSRLRLGRALEVVAACVLLGALLGLGVMYNLNASHTPADVSPPPPPVDVNPPAPAARCIPQPPPDRAGFATLSVYFSCDEDTLPATPRPVPRQVPTDAATPRTALEELLKGPTQDERSSGYGSAFSASTAGMLNSVTITDNGRAIVDFKDFSGIIPNSSTSTGRGQLLRELRLTLAQFEEIREIEYRFDGDCQAFWFWLQDGCRALPVATDEANQWLTELREQKSFPIYVPTEVPSGFVPQMPTSKSGMLINVVYLAQDGTVGLRVATGPAGCCLDADSRKAVEPTPVRDGITAYFIPNQPEFGGPILWWQEEGAYIALSGPQLTKEDLSAIAASMSATATLMSK